MERAPGGTSVGVDDPYAHVDRCDFVTSEGRCRWAREHGEQDPAFADRLAAQDFACPVVASVDDPDALDESIDHDVDWASCPHFRCREHDRSCARCGLEERRLAHEDERPLLEEHHLAYAAASDDEVGHEITVYLCRWCHAKVHRSWARIDDDASPDPEAVAAREGRLSREREELTFETAADRWEGADDERDAGREQAGDDDD
jgi:hypothetical protein